MKDIKNKKDEVDCTSQNTLNFIEEEFKLFLQLESINLNLHLNYNTIDELSQRFVKFLDKKFFNEVG
jgi:hypothetical protein